MTDDRALGVGLADLPVEWLARLQEHLRAEGRVKVDYGWQDGETPAISGCPVGICISKERYLYLCEQSPVESDDYHLGIAARRVADELFPAWAARYVQDAEADLPDEGRRRLLEAVGYALQVAGEGRA
ncbi:MAG: hypothetical protein ACYDGR_12745 [Candidatus Dormibacteria bacterium]